MSALVDVAKPVIGMLHAPPLPGAPRYGGDFAAVERAVLRDAEALAEGGAHALMLENFGDAPFFPGRVPTHTATHLTALALAVRRVSGLPLGINALRNDGLSALAVAAAAGAAFVRVNVLTGARVTDQGLIQGIAHDLLRYRRELDADVRIVADVAVKHSAPLADFSLQDEVKDAVQRGLADVLVVSGAGTGQPVDPARLTAVKAAAGTTPVWLGSGVTSESLVQLAPHADGFIVGTAFKRDGVPTTPVDPARVRTMLEAWRAL